MFKKSTSIQSRCYKQRGVCERRNISWAPLECTSINQPTHLGYRNITSFYLFKPNEIQLLSNIFIFQDPFFILGVVHESQVSRVLEWTLHSVVVMVATAGNSFTPFNITDTLEVGPTGPVGDGSWSLQPSWPSWVWGAAWSVPSSYQPM